MRPPIDDIRAAILVTLHSIPRGHVTSYSEVARRAGLPGYTRFVCRVLRELEDRTRVPWWRVIRASGHFAMAPHSSGGREQRRRLRAEGVEILKDRVRGPCW